MNESSLQENWQVDIGGDLFEADLQVITQWIAEGSLLPSDLVRRGNLRWIQAEKVPALIPFFNAKEQGAPPPILTSTTNANTQKVENFAPTQSFAANNFQTTYAEPPQPDFFPPQPEFPQSETIPQQNICVIHTDAEAKYFCDTCLNSFCGVCPKSYGGSVKICPMCGSMCKSIQAAQTAHQKSFQYQQDMRQGFGFGDFGDALVYPLKYKTSYIIGAIFFMFFTLGQQSSGMGSIFLISASITCFMLANMLTFGILANVTENFSQGKVGGNFMPSFDDFNLWDDMVNPFFLSIGVYIVSFGLMIVLIIGAAWYMANQLTSNVPQNISQQVSPNGLDSAKQLPQFREMANKMNERSLYQNGEMPDEEHIANSQNGVINSEEQQFQDVQKTIGQQRKQELESIAGKSPEEESAEMEATAKNFIKTVGLFGILIFLAFLWGIFYFPAACAVAGYTRSFSATLNPTVGLDTIKRLGADYFKILGMGLILVIISGVVTIILNLIFSPFNLPRMGNLPAIAVGSWFTFYISIVFSVILGFALYKNAEKMNLFRNR